MGKRDESRQRTTAAILLAARAEIAEFGGVGLSMRRIAREVGLVSSAIYRYYPSREALLTAMIVESYGHLARVLAEVEAEAEREGRNEGDAASARWRGLAEAFRVWALANPHEFQLVYGTPVPGYVAPPETVPAATAVALPFLRAGAMGRVEGYDAPDLLAQMSAFAEVAEPAIVAAVLAELAALVGMVSLELDGHFVGTADPAGPLFGALIDRQVGTLGLR